MDHVNRLINQIQKENDETAINDLIKLYYHEIFAYVYKQLLDRDASLDYTQEIFIKVIKSIKKYNHSKSSFRTYLYRIANHYLIDRYRLRKTKTIELTEVYQDDCDLLEELVKEEQIEFVNQLILRLTTSEQEIIRLRFFAECTLNEIGLILDLNLSTVKNRLYHSLKKLKNWIEGDFHE